MLLHQKNVRTGLISVPILETLTKCRVQVYNDITKWTDEPNTICFLGEFYSKDFFMTLPACIWKKGCFIKIINLHQKSNKNFPCMSKRPKARACKTVIKWFIFWYGYKIVCNTMLYLIFQYAGSNTADINQFQRHT